MNKKSAALAAMTVLGGLAALPAVAQADEAKVPGVNTGHFYAGAGVNLYFIDKGDAAEGLPVEFVDQPSPGAFMGRVGYAFNDLFAIEAQAGIGGAKQDFKDDAGVFHGEVGVTNPLAADVVLTIPVGHNGGTYLLGKAGYTSFTIERSLNGVDAPDIDVSGAEFGVGAGVRNGAWDLRGEYSFVSGDASSGVLDISILRTF